MLKRIKSKKGFTLVELMIGLVVFMFLVGAATSIIMVSFNIYARSAVRNHAQQKGDEIYSLIESRLTYAANLTITTDESTLEGAAEPYTCIYIPSYGDRVCIGNTIPANSEAVSPSELEGLTVKVKIRQGSGDDVLTLAVEIFRDSEAVYSHTGSVMMMNANNAAVSEYCEVPYSTSNSFTDMYIVFTELG